jgi:hypothetical protein
MAASPTLSPRAATVVYLTGVWLSLALATAWLHADALRAGGLGVFRLIQHHLERSDQLLHAWTLGWLWHQLPRAPVELFAANTFYPHPASLALSDHLLGVAVTLLPLRPFVDDPLGLATLGTLLTFPLAGTAVAWLVLRLTGSMSAGWIGGLLYAFNPFRLQNYAQIQLLTDYGSALSLLVLDRYTRHGRERDLYLLAALAAWQTLCSAYLGAYLAVLLGILLAWTWWREPGLRPRPQTVVAAALVGAVVVGPFLYPYLRLRALGQLHQHEINSIALSLGLADLVCWSKCTSFFGLALVPTSLVLAAAALWPPARRGSATLATIALLGAVMALGPYVHVSSLADPEAAPRFLAPGPYWVLQRWAPGFDGLRAPARAIVLTHLALAGLAGMGAARLLALPRLRSWRILTGVALATLAVATVGRPAVVFEPLPAARQVPEVSRWLADEPSAAPVVEIPASSYDDLIMYNSRVHWRPMVNGYSGFLPFGHRYVVAALRCYPCPGALRALADIGVRTHLVHLHLLPAARRATIGEKIAATPSLRIERQIGDTLVVSFAPDRLPAADPPADLTPLPRGGWTATSSLGEQGAARAIDDSLDTAWTTGLRLEALRSPLRGLELLQRVRSWPEFVALVPRAPAWFALDLGVPREVHGIDIAYWDESGTIQGAPVVEGSRNGDDWFALPSDPSVLPAVGLLDRRPPPARLRYTWPPATLRFLRLRLSGFWFLHDVEVLE